MKNKYLSFILIAFLLVGTLFLSACTSEKVEETFEMGQTISTEEAKEIAENFINDYLMLDGARVSVSFYGHAYGMYHLKISIEGQEPVDSFITKDGKLFFPQHLEIQEIIELAEMQDAMMGELDPSMIGEPLDLNEEFFATDSKVTVYFFGTDTCPFCRNQKEAMIEWEERFSSEDLEIREFVTDDMEVMDIVRQLSASYGTNYQGVPMTFIGSEYWIGYSPDLGQEMIEKIEYCLEADCENPMERLR